MPRPLPPAPATPSKTSTPPSLAWTPVPMAIASPAAGASLSNGSKRSLTPASASLARPCASWWGQLHTIRETERRRQPC
jgi:hypothetical protein